MLQRSKRSRRKTKKQFYTDTLPQLSKQQEHVKKIINEQRALEEIKPYTDSIYGQIRKTQ